MFQVGRVGPGIFPNGGVASYTGIGDIVAATFGVSANQPLTGAYAASGNKAVTFRNGTSGATGSIGWIDNKFDTASWNLASNNGAEILYVTSALDQIGSNDAVQTIGTKQPILLSNGCIVYDGSDDYLLASGVAEDSSKISFTAVVNISNLLNSNIIIAQDDLSNRNWNCYTSTANDGITITIFQGGASKTTKIDNIGALIADGNNHMLCGAYDSVLGWSFYIDGVSQSITTNRTGLIDTDGPALSLGAVGNGGSVFTGCIDAATFIAGHTITAQEAVDIYTQWEANKL